MRVLVTGGTGFIGQHVLRLLAQNNFEIHVTLGPVQDNPAPSFSTPFLTKTVTTRADQITFHQVDLLDEKAVEACFNKVRPTHLLHLAWYAEPGKFWTSPSNRTWQTASLHLAKAFYAAGGSKAVVAGTGAEYDWTVGGCFDAQTSQLNPSTLYGQCKLDLFNKLRFMTADQPSALAWGRVFWLYGEGEALGRLVSSAFHSLMTGQEFPTTLGTQLRDFLHVEDVARGFVSALMTNLSGPFNIASGEGRPVRELLEKIGHLTGRGELIQFGAIPLKPEEPRELSGNCDPLKAVGWRPKLDLTAGLSRTYLWWKAQLEG